MAKSICKVDGCEAPLTGGNGYCGRHYMRWRRYGDALYERPTYAVCTVEGCERAPRSRYAEHCETHYYRLRRTGTAHDHEWATRFITEHGYVMVKRPGHPMAGRKGWVYEHRFVAAEKLGRPLERSEYVHHIDADPTNNASDNLVVVSGSEHGRIHRLVERGMDPRQAVDAVMNAPVAQRT